MKTIKFCSLLAIIALGLSSCSPNLSPFTENLYDDNAWSDSELQQIQFYVSEDVVLRREVSDGASTIESGKIKMVNGRKVEEVVIRKGTPGVFLFKPKENRFAVSFESGNDNAYLMFGPNPKARGKYVLLASKWKDRRGVITYDDRKFYTPTTSAYAALMVDMKRIRNVSTRRRTAAGRSVN